VFGRSTEGIVQPGPFLSPFHCFTSSIGSMGRFVPVVTNMNRCFAGAID